MAIYIGKQRFGIQTVPIKLVEKSNIFVGEYGSLVQSDSLSIITVTYDQLNDLTQEQLSNKNQLYLVNDDSLINCYGKRVTNIQEGTEYSDAVTFNQLTSMSINSNVLKDLSVSQTDGIEQLRNILSTVITRFGGNGGNGNIEPDDTKTFTVKFFDIDRTTILKTQVVKEGQSAVPPSPLSHDGQIFQYWDGNYSNVTSDLSVYAIYSQAKRVYVTIQTNDQTMGTVSDGGNRYSGSEMTIVASPATGYRFIKWEIAGQEISQSSTYKFVVPDEDVVIVAIFEEEQQLASQYYVTGETGLFVSDPDTKLVIIPHTFHSAFQNRELSACQNGRDGEAILEPINAFPGDEFEFSGTSAMYVKVNIQRGGNSAFEANLEEDRKYIFNEQAQRVIISFIKYSDSTYSGMSGITYDEFQTLARLIKIKRSANNDYGVSYFYNRFIISPYTYINTNTGAYGVDSRTFCLKNKIHLDTGDSVSWIGNTEIRSELFIWNSSTGKYTNEHHVLNTSDYTYTATQPIDITWNFMSTSSVTPAPTMMDSIYKYFNISIQNIEQ